MKRKIELVPKGEIQLNGILYLILFGAFMGILFGSVTLFIVMSDALKSLWFLKVSKYI